MNGIYSGELIRDGQVIHTFAQKNRMIRAAADFNMAGMFKNLYLNTLIDQFEFYIYGDRISLAASEYLIDIPMDYPSICPTPDGQFYMGLIRADNSLVYSEAAFFAKSVVYPRFNESTNYMNSDGFAQRPLWQPDAPIKGTITNTTNPTRFLFTSDDAVFGLFLGASPNFNNGILHEEDDVFADPGRIISICSLPYAPDGNFGQTFRPRAGDELRVHYMVYF